MARIPARVNAIMLRLLPQERRIVERAAMKAGERPSTWARRVVLTAAIDAENPALKVASR